MWNWFISFDAFFGLDCFKFSGLLCHLFHEKKYVVCIFFQEIKKIISYFFREICLKKIGLVHTKIPDRILPRLIIFLPFFYRKSPMTLFQFHFGKAIWWYNVGLSEIKFIFSSKNSVFFSKNFSVILLLFYNYVC